MTKLAPPYPLTLQGCLDLLSLSPGEQPDKYQRAAMRIAVADAIKRIALEVVPDKQPSIMETLQRIREAGGYVWDNVDTDPSWFIDQSIRVYKGDDV